MTLLQRNEEKKLKITQFLTNFKLTTLPEVPGAQGGQYHNTNIVTLTLLEVPSAQEDDVDTVYPGHQIPRKRLSSLYSYTVTSKTPNQRVSTKYVVILRETPGDDFCYSGVFAVAEHEYRDGNALLGSWCPGWAVSTSSPTVSRKINDFFVVTPTATLLEVPSAQGEIRYSRISGATEHGYGAVLKIIPEDDVDTVYPGHQIPRKRLSSLYSYTVTSKTPNQRDSTK
ncbi:hypothetical protein TSAR_006471 [Trichomalopsis sarcophagae]|uniref:Uncharacterized protein n=1 Tax=Trichomalopsis sarcophagae TaxID=543379 RepID=A0A232EML9_9HYME|nr:hypothetical protein TSAR_006471 [Trichomalopsis sarcophagae]